MVIESFAIPGSIGSIEAIAAGLLHEPGRKGHHFGLTPIPQVVHFFLESAVGIEDMSFALSSALTCETDPRELRELPFAVVVEVLRFEVGAAETRLTALVD